MAGKSKDKYIIDPSCLQKIEQDFFRQLGNVVRAGAGKNVVNNLSVKVKNLFVTVAEDRCITDPSRLLRQIEEDIIRQLGKALGGGAGNNVVNNLSIKVENLVVKVAEKERCFDYCCYAANPREQRGGGFKCASCGRKLTQTRPKAITFKFQP